MSTAPRQWLVFVRGRFRGMPANRFHTVQVLALAVLSCWAPSCFAAARFEPFSTDPSTSGRFTTQVAGTESTFTHQAAAGNLRAILDVDASTASYLSVPFPAVTDRESSSFSFAFRVEDVDDRNTPTAFVGLMTPVHVENFGDGLTVALALSRQTGSVGRLVATASIDHAGFKTGGVEVTLTPRTDYLAAASYSALSRTLTVDLYTGREFTVRAGRSEAVLPIGQNLRLTQLGIQNGGARTVDSTIGSITITLDDLATPGRPPISLFAEAVDVPEGTDGAVSAVVQVLLSAPTDVPVSVDYLTGDLTATAGSDYQPVAGTLVIPAGSAGARLVIPILPDALAEESEAFQVAFRNPVNANLALSEVTVSILDDDTPAIQVGSAEGVEGHSGGSIILLPVRLSNPSSLPVQVQYTTLDETAAAGSDYVGTHGTLHFPPGTTEQSVPLTLLGDLIAEGNEGFRVELSAPVNAVLDPAAMTGALVTLLDDDPVPFIDVSNASVVEGHAGPVIAAVTVRLSNASALPVTVTFATLDGSAQAGSDYLERTGTLRFEPGELEQSVAITVLGDTAAEANESFQLVLAQPTQGRLDRATAQITILDDEQAPALSIADASAVEGGSGQTTTLTFDVVLGPPATVPVTVHYATFAGTAAAGVDFVSGSGTLTFTPGTTRQPIAIRVQGDDEAEPDEVLTVRLSNPLNAALDRAEATGTILTDDSVTLSVGDITVTEADGADIQAVFLVSLKGTPAQAVTVGFFTGNVSALAGIDYQARSGVLRFEPGQTLQTVSVPILGDYLDEPEEAFEFRLHTASGATLSRAVGTATIRDNDPPSLSLSPVQVLEGSGGPTNARVVVRLSSPTFEQVQVDFQTLERTATSGADYLPAIGTLTFPAGTSERLIDISVLGDTVDEADETFAVRLLRPQGASLTVTEALVTIRDDDDAPRIRITDREVTECSSGTASVSFEVTLSAPSEQVVTVDFSTFADSAHAGEDYLEIGGRLVFPPGTTVQRIEVPLICDTQDEPSEGFGIGLGNPSNGFIGGDGRGRATVIDDDPPELSIADVRVLEGQEGLSNAVFVVRLSSPSSETITVTFSTRDETASQGTDYAAVSGSVILLPGVLSQEVGVPVIGDSLPEGDETFLVRLSDPLNASLSAFEARGILLDDDQPVIRAEDATVVETDEGRFPVRMTLTLTRTTPQPVAVAFETRDGTARAGADYEKAAGVVRFAPGETRQEIDLTGLGDTLIEGPETFSLHFSNPTHGVLATDAAQITLVDNDGAAVLSVLDVAIDEGQAGPRSLVFALRLSAASSVAASVSYATVDVTATAGKDYVTRSGTVNFSPGVTLQTVAVPVLGDVLSEPDESFLLILSHPVQAVLARPQALGTIRNDDPIPVLAVADTAIEEGGPGRSTNLVFRVTLTPPSSTPVSVRYATVPLTASAGADFEATTGLLTFPSGTAAQTIPVTVFGDAEAEPNETLALRLSDPVDADLGRAEAVGTLVDDDGIPIRIADASVREPDLGSVGMAFVVSLERPASQLITVEYATRDGSASSGADYAGASGTLYFPAGLTQQTLTVAVHGDTLDEPDETLELQLSNPIHGVLAGPAATGTILDNDPPRLEIDDVTVLGSQGGAVDAVFTIRLSTPSGEPVTVEFATANGTATSGTDYSETARTLTFSPGQIQRTVSVEVKGNTLDEQTEHFLVNLSHPTNATPGRMQGRGTILNRIVVNLPPRVLLTTPSDGARIPGPADVTLTATATDPEGPVARVEFFADSISLGEDLTVPFALVWNQAPPGRHTLTARATDGGGLVSTSAPVRIDISPPNSPPTLGAIAPQTILEDTSTGPLEFVVTDTGTSTDLLEVRVTSSNPSLLPSDGLRLAGTHARRSVTLTPTENGFGEATVQLVVQDTEGLTATNRLELTVLPVNDPPTLAPIADQTLTEDAPVQFVTLTGIGTGAPNELQALTLTASSGNPSLIPHPGLTDATPGPTAVLSFEPRPGASGTTILTVLLRDDGGTAHGGLDTLVRQFAVTVTPVNDPPEVQWLEPADGSQFPSGGSITLRATASDPDDGIASVEFLLGNETLGRATRPPYQIVWANAPSGIHRVIARARDSAVATADTPPLAILVSDPARDLPPGDILIVRAFGSPETDTLKRYIDDSQLEVPDESSGRLREPVVVIADRDDLRIERMLGFRAVVWHDRGPSQPGLEDREIHLLWQAWRFGIPLYFIGEDLSHGDAALGSEARQRWTQLTGLIPGGPTVGPGRIAAEEPRARSQELFWGSLPETVSIILEDFEYPRPTQTGRLVGDGEVRASLSGIPVLTRYPAFNSPFDGSARRLVQNFLVTAGSSTSLEERRLLFLNGVLWLLGNECDNFLTEPFCTVIPPEDPSDPCAPFTLLARLANNGRCQARGVTLTTVLPDGVEWLDVQIRSHPEGANSGTAYRDGRQWIFAIGRVEHDTEIEIEARVLVPHPGAFVSRWITRSLYRPIYECTTPFTAIGPGCAQPRLEVRHSPSGQPEFRVAEPAGGSLNLEVSEDLIQWTPTGAIAPGTWLTTPLLPGNPPSAPRQLFLRLVRPADAL